MGKSSSKILINCPLVEGHPCEFRVRGRLKCGWIKAIRPEEKSIKVDVFGGSIKKSGDKPAIYQAERKIADTVRMSPAQLFMPSECYWHAPEKVPQSLTCGVYVKFLDAFYQVVSMSYISVGLVSLLSPDEHIYLQYDKLHELIVITDAETILREKKY